MARPLLAATKFTVPARPARFVQRGRLLTALDDGATVPLTVVVGVPGAGKSALLASWLHDRPQMPSVWFSCDSRDADPEMFWHALCAALTHARPDHWLDMAELLEEPEPDLGDVAIAVVNDLLDLGEKVVIVIDDFQFAADAAPSLVTLIERLPTGCRVVVGSRTEPQLALHRLRAHGQVHEVRDPELRLTTCEVADVLDEFGIGLSATEIELLANRTEGWIAGVQMAAVSLRDHSDRDRFLADLAKSPRAITDFLGTEVLDGQPVDVRRFLLATSVLDVLEPASCAAVTERGDASTMLGCLEERNLFLISLGLDTYRYHHLFAELLRHHLRAEEPDLERALHRRAAAFFVEADDPESAIDHLLAAGAEEEAFEVLRSNLVDAFYQGDGRTPRRLFSRFERSSSAIDPAHLPDLALAVAASGPTGAAEPWISRATAHSADLSDEHLSRVAIARALVAMRDGEAAEIERALASCPAPEGLPDQERYGYIPSLLARSRLWLGDARGARDICERVLEAADRQSALHVVMACGLAWVACVEGQLTEAKDVADRALASAQTLGLTGHPVTVEALCAQGRVAFERGDLALAEQVLEQAVSVSEDVRPAFAAESQLVLARVWLTQGLASDATDGVARARALLRTNSTSPLVALCDAFDVRIAVDTGRLDHAAEAVRSLAPGIRATLLRARIGLAAARFEQARDEVASCEPVTMRQRLDVALLGARIAHGLGSDDADERLGAVIDLARVEGFVVVLADDLAELRPQLLHLLRAGRVGMYEQAVLDRIERGLPTSLSTGGEGGLLSEREMTVLRYLPSRLTNQEIASEIFVSTNTVKTHVRRIYQKLGVSSRTEAIAEARRLGWF